MKLGQKFTVYISLLILLLTGTMFLIIAQSGIYTNSYQKILYNVYLLNETYSLLEETEEELEDYLTTKTISNNESFNRKFDELYRAINSMPIAFSTREEQFAYSNIRGTLITLNLKIEECLKAHRGRDPQTAQRYYEEVERIDGQMRAAIDYLVLKYMSASHELYDYIERDRRRSQIFSLGIILGMAAFSFLSTITFVKKLTDSLKTLSRHVESFAKEPENTHVVRINSRDEVGTLAEGFNAMSEEIRTYIRQASEKMQVEQELRDAELKMLQAQINPHFLFNTLNCIAQNALLEEADKTYQLILTVSGMLRYNLRQLDKPVKLREELDNLRKYIYIQKERYGDKIEFQMEDVEEEILDIRIPSLTIQPVVENSVIHGLEVLERKGYVAVRAYRREDEVWVVVADNGTGMDEKTLNAIKNPREEGKKLSGHSTGIGIRNVIYRLKLYYGKDEFQIESEVGKGTRITLRLPFRQAEEGREPDAELIDCR